MSSTAVAALRAEGEQVLAVYRSLDDREWQLPSDCEGWSVQDVLAHMSSLFGLVISPRMALSAMRSDDAASIQRRNVCRYLPVDRR